MKEHTAAADRERDSLVRILSFDTLDEKARWLDAAASFDATLDYLRDFCHRQFSYRHFTQDENHREALVRAIHRWVRDNIHYVQDYRITQGKPGEEFADSETVLKRGYDDCDGKSRLFVALCRIMGVDAIIRPVFKPHPLDFVHVQALVRWPGSTAKPYADKDGWCLAEMILKGCEIGQNPDDVPRGPKGERVLA